MSAMYHTLVLSDKTTLKISDALKMSVFWRNLVEDCDETTNIPVPQISGVESSMQTETFKKIVEYMEHHYNPTASLPQETVQVEGTTTDSEKKHCSWDVSFAASVVTNIPLVGSVMNAGVYLDLGAIVTLLAGAFSDYYLKGKEPEETAKMLGVDISGFTPEMEEQMKKDEPWIEEKHDDVPTLFPKEELERSSVCKCCA